MGKGPGREARHGWLMRQPFAEVYAVVAELSGLLTIRVFYRVLRSVPARTVAMHTGFLNSTHLTQDFLGCVHVYLVGLNGPNRSDRVPSDNTSVIGIE